MEYNTLISKDLAKLINHCEKQIKLSYAFNDKKHLEEHETILKIIDEYKKVKHENQELRRNISSILNNNGFEFKNGNGELVCKLDNNLQALIKENQELKKQIEADYTSVYLKACEDTKDKYKIQQKEFMKYLEDGINNIKEQIKNYDIWHEVGTDINFLILKKQFNIEMLSKYKEIVGVKDENK